MSRHKGSIMRGAESGEVRGILSPARGVELRLMAQCATCEELVMLTGLWIKY